MRKYTLKRTYTIKSAQQFKEWSQRTAPGSMAKLYSAEVPEEVWMEIIKRYRSLREAVPYSGTVPPHILERLSHDKNWRTRAGVANNRRTPVETLRRLASDPKQAVRKDVSINPSCPTEILQQLQYDDVPQVSMMAIKKLLERGFLPDIALDELDLKFRSYCMGLDCIEMYEPDAIPKIKEQMAELKEQKKDDSQA